MLKCVLLLWALMGMSSLSQAFSPPEPLFLNCDPVSGCVLNPLPLHLNVHDDLNPGDLYLPGETAYTVYAGFVTHSGARVRCWQSPRIAVPFELQDTTLPVASILSKIFMTDDMDLQTFGAGCNFVNRTDFRAFILGVESDIYQHTDVYPVWDGELPPKSCTASLPDMIIEGTHGEDISGTTTLKLNCPAVYQLRFQAGNPGLTSDRVDIQMSDGQTVSASVSLNGQQGLPGIVADSSVTVVLGMEILAGVHVGTGQGVGVLRIEYE